jgi:uncharacterized membrane protein
MQYTLDLVGVLALLLQVVLPLVVALVTNSRTASSVKGILLLALTAVTQFLMLWYQDAQHKLNFEWKIVLFNVVIGFVVSVATYFGYWRGTQIRARLAAIGDPNVRPVR